MAKRGRKPTPEYLQVVDGDARPSSYDGDRCGYPTNDGSPCTRKADGRCWQHDGQPDPEREAYPPPGHLGAIAGHLWRRTVSEAVRLGILTKLDWPMFESYCELYESKRRAYEDWKEGDVTEPSDHGGGNKKNAAWTIYQQAANAFRLHASEMGFTPTARPGLDIGKDEREEEDPIRDIVSF